MIVNDMVLKAICWTLLHSVWQGFLLAFAAGLVILFTRKSTSALRYNLLAGLFTGFIILSGITLNYELQNQSAETITRLNLPVHQLTDTFGDSVSNAIPIGYSDILIEFFNKQSGIIVLIWFLIFSFRCFGIFANFSYIYRIRNYKIQAPSDFWIAKVADLARRINIEKHIVLLESRLVKVPSVTGFFKPVILIPIGLLSNLPQDQVEAILLHELAHIKRKDYFINILQSFAEVLFFFNPGVLWLSTILRDERENCCDDIAISASVSRTQFVSALVSFEEYNLRNNQLALGFGGNKNHLLTRAKRIIYNDNKTLNQIEKTVFAFSFVAIATVMVACSNVVDTVVEPAITSAQIKADRSAQKANDLAQNLIDKSDLAESRSVLEAYNEANKADIAAAEASAIAANSDRIAAKATVLAKKADAEVKKSDAEARKADAMAQAADVEAKTVRNSVKTTTTQNQHGKTVTIEKSVYRSETGRPKVGSFTGISGENLTDNVNTERLTQNIISDLLAENIISDTKNLSYKLSNKSLIVNGITQPESKFRKVQKKYVRSDSYSICYNYEVSSTNN